MVPTELIHDVSSLATNKELCHGLQCKYHYYQYRAPNITAVERNRTVLMVAGMHGNQVLGPHALLYGYQHFDAPHIIYFPLANPSGFIQGSRLTYPLKKDPNRDFPIDGNTRCYQTNAALILDYIFRNYKIDLTFILHNGGTQIGFNWGTNYHQQKHSDHSQDYKIQNDIAQMLNKMAGKNKRL